MPVSGAGRWNHRFAAHLGVHNIAHPLFEFSARSNAADDQIEYAAEAGFAGMCDNSLKDRSAADQTQIRHALERVGLEFGSFCHVPAGHSPSTWSLEDLNAEKELASSFEAAERVGGRRIIVVVCDLGGDPAVQIQNATRALGRGAEAASRRGLVLELEPVSRLRMSVALVNTAHDADSIISRVDNPALRLIADTVHLSLSGEGAAAVIRNSAATLGGVQIADIPDRVEPGAGDLNLADVLAAVDAIGWTGLIEAEFAASRPGPEGEDAVLRALDVLDAPRPLEKEQL